MWDSKKILTSFGIYGTTSVAKISVTAWYRKNLRTRILFGNGSVMEATVASLTKGLKKLRSSCVLDAVVSVVAITIDHMTT
jgi:hypothetical protein